MHTHTDTHTLTLTHKNKSMKIIGTIDYSMHTRVTNLAII